MGRGITVTADLVLGTAQLGSAYGVSNQEGELSREAAFKVLDAAWESGVRVLDTAEAYGSSQAVIGAYHNKHQDRLFRVCSKLSAEFDREAPDLKAEIGKRVAFSLDELRVPSFHVYYLHSFDMCKDAALMAELRELREGSLVESIGVSLYEPEELEYLIERRKGSVDAVQIPFNVFNCAQWIQDDLLHRASAAGIAVFARSVYLQGLVFKDSEDVFVKALGLSEALDLFQSKAEATGISCSQLACDFVRSFEDISYIVLGCESPRQAKENAQMFTPEPSTWRHNDLVEQIKESAHLPKRALDPRCWPKF